MSPRSDSPPDRPMRLRCTCLVINAPDDLQVVEQDAGEPGPGQVVVQVVVQVGFWRHLRV